MDADSDGIEVDVVDWLSKTNRLMEAMKKAHAAADDEDVDNQVLVLQRQIEHRNMDIADQDRQIEDSEKNINTQKCQIENLKRQIDALTASLTTMRESRESCLNKNANDMRKIDEIKLSQQKAKNCLLSIEGAIQTLKATMEPAPKAGESAAKKHVRRFRCILRSDGRLRQSWLKHLSTSRKTRFFEDIFNGGSPTHEIIEFPEGQGTFFVLECAEHGVKFGKQAVFNAAVHSCSEGHNPIARDAYIFTEFGMRVLCVTTEKMALNNKMLEERRIEETIPGSDGKHRGVASSQTGEQT